MKKKKKKSIFINKFADKLYTQQSMSKISTVQEISSKDIILCHGSGFGFVKEYM